MIEFGDCRETMRRWAEQGIKAQTCVTSPPYYGLRDYGHDGQIGLEETPEEYIKAMVEVFRCVRDVLADDGTLWLNIGDSYYNYRPGKGQALVKQSVSNTKQDLPDTCARRGNILPGLKEKDLIGIPWMLAFALRADGWYLRQDIIWHKPNPMPESVQDRCTKAHEYIFLLSKSEKYYYDIDAIREPHSQAEKDGVTKEMMQKEWTAKRESQGKVQSDQSGKTSQGGTVNRNKNYYGNPEGRNKRSVWTVTTKPYSGAHFATFPFDLITPCILAGAPAGGVVLDPFMGSGTTAAVAVLNGRNYLGCELNPAYKDLQDERIRNAHLETAQMELI
jgi:DNA modification methylase